MKNIKNIIGTTAAYFIVIVMLIAFVLFIVSNALADTPKRDMSRHQKLYDQRIDNDQAQGKFIEGNRYQKMMRIMDEFDDEDQRLTDEMIDIQDKLRRECMYWDSEHASFYEAC